MADLNKAWEDSIPISEWDEAKPITGDSGIPGMSELDIGMSPEEVAGYAPDVLGAAGGVGGFAVGGVPGAMAGAGAGGFLGTLAEQQIQGRGTDLAEAGKEAALQAAFEGGGAIIAKVGGKLVSPLKKRLRPDVTEMEKLYSQYGGRFSPAQATSSKTMDTLEAIAENSMFGGNKVYHFREGQIDNYQDMVKDIVDQIGTKMEPNEIANVFSDELNKKNLIFRGIAGKLYKRVDRMTGGAIVDLTPLKREAAQFYAQSQKFKGIGDEVAADNMVKRIFEFEDSLVFEDAHELRSRLIADIGKFENKAKGKRIVTIFTGKVDEAMEVASKKVGDDAYKAWRNADSFYKKGKERFGNDVVEYMMDTARTPLLRDMFVNRAFLNSRPDRIREIKKTLGPNSPAWEKLRKSFIGKIIKESSEGDVVLGKKGLRRLQSFGEESLKEVLSPTEIKLLKDAFSIGKVLQTPTKGGGAMLIQLTQAGAIVGLATGRFQKEALTVTLGPYALAHIITKEGGQRLLKEGLRVPASSPLAVSNAARLIGMLIESGTNDYKIKPY